MDKYKKRRLKARLQGYTMIFIVLAIIIGIAYSMFAPHTVRNTYTATVTEKQVKRSGDSDTYLIYTKLDNGAVRVFENTDSLFERKWNSSDVYAEIEVGSTYKFTVYGWRKQWLSWYENIVSFIKVK